MNQFESCDFEVEHSQCLVCEKAIADSGWFARLKLEGHTVTLCSQYCAKHFYAKRLPLLRRIAVQIALRSARWPCRREFHVRETARPGVFRG